MRAAIILLSLLASLPAAAQQTGAPSRAAQLAPPPAASACTAELEGQLSCQANRVCECVHSTGVPARGLPARWHWDCDIKRPKCTVTPESFGAYPYVPPYAVEIERGAEHPEAEDEIPPPPR